MATGAGVGLPVADGLAVGDDLTEEFPPFLPATPTTSPTKNAAAIARIATPRFTYVPNLKRTQRGLIVKGAVAGWPSYVVLRPGADGLPACPSVGRRPP